MAEESQWLLMSLFKLCDHDFTKSGIIPSVTFLVDVPDNIEQSCYTGNVYIGVKDSVLEASFPFWHACELYSILMSLSSQKHILFLYTVVALTTI